MSFDQGYRVIDCATATQNLLLAAYALDLAVNKCLPKGRAYGRTDGIVGFAQIYLTTLKNCDRLSSTIATLAGLLQNEVY